MFKNNEVKLKAFINLFEWERTNGVGFANAFISDVLDNKTKEEFSAFRTRLLEQVSEDEKVKHNQRAFDFANALKEKSNEKK